MDIIDQALQIHPPEICKAIENLIHTTMEKLARDGAILAISGGLDSAVTATLTVRSLGVEMVQFLNMPDRDSKPVHQEHAKQLARHLGVPLTIKPITSTLRANGSYKLLPLGYVPGRRIRTMLVDYGKSRFMNDQGNQVLAARLQPEANSWISKGNAYVLAKHRIRMARLYQYAEIQNLMVVGAANRTEWLTGTFSKWGVDHCADVMPVLHLYRSQLEEVAEYLQVPEIIRTKAADPDVMPGIDDKGKLLGNFETADQILTGLELGIEEDVLRQNFGKENVERILTLIELSRHMRESPYHL